MTGDKDESDSAGMVIWDLQKALDTVNHDIFPTKLRALDFNGGCRWDFVTTPATKTNEGSRREAS